MKKSTRILPAMLIGAAVGFCNVSFADDNGNGNEPPDTDATTNINQQTTVEKEDQTSEFCDTFEMLCDIFVVNGNGNGTEPPS